MSKQIAVKSLSEVAEVYAVNTDSVKRWRSEGMPGKPGRYVLRDVSEWLRTDGPWRQKAAVSIDDPLLAEGDSPALERYRLAKAKLAELDLENRKGDLIEVAKCRDLLARWAVVLRRMGERLAKRYGNDASLTVNESLSECKSVADGMARIA